MNDIWGMDFDSGNIQEKSEWASEEDIGIVSENLKKAQQIWWQIKKNQAQNQKSAHMLLLLLKFVDNDKIWTWIYRLINEYSVDIKDIFALFYVFIGEKIEEPDIHAEFQDQCSVNSNSLSEYSDFLKTRMQLSESIMKLDSKFFLDFVVSVILYFGVWWITQEKQSDLIESLKNSLYW